MSDRNAAHEANMLNAAHAATSELKRIRESLDAELATLRAALAKEKERADEWKRNAHVVEQAANAWRDDAERLHARYKDLYAMWLRVARAITPVGGPDITDEQVADTAEALAATLAEREAQHEREKRLLVGESCSHLKHIEALGRALGEREAEIERLKQEIIYANARTSDARRDAKDADSNCEMYARAWARELGAPYVAKTHRIDALVLTTQERIKERDEARAALATARKEALEEAAKECDVFLSETGPYGFQSRYLAEKIRALAGLPECGGNHCWKAEDGKTVHSSKSYSTCRALASDTTKGET